MIFIWKVLPGRDAGLEPGLATRCQSEPVLSGARADTYDMPPRQNRSF